MSGKVIPGARTFTLFLAIVIFVTGGATFVLLLARALRPNKAERAFGGTNDDDIERRPLGVDLAALADLIGIMSPRQLVAIASYSLAPKRGPAVVALLDWIIH